MNKLLKKLVVFLKNIHPYIIFKDVMECFIMSCGIAFLIIYFNWDRNNILNKELFFNMETIVFSLLLTLLVIYAILTKRWFGEYGIISDMSPSGNAIIGDRKISESRRRTSAVHEAGHALMAYLKQLESFSVILSDINPRVETVTQIYSAEDVKNNILIYYSGAAAEEILLGNMCMGAMYGNGADFKEAKDFIKAYIIMTDPTVSKSFLDEELSDNIVAYSKKFYKMAFDILSEHKEMLTAIANELMRKNELSKEEIYKLLKNFPEQEEEYARL